MSVDARFERFVLAELALQERRAHRRDDSHRARVLAHETDVTPEALSTAGLTAEEMSALKLLAAAGSTSRARPLLGRMRTLSKAPGSAGYLARVVARAAIQDRLDGARPDGETLTALSLLPNPRLAM